MKGSRRLTKGTINEIKKFGSTYIDKVSMRLAWAFLGRRSTGKVTESIGSSKSSCAKISSSIKIIVASIFHINILFF